MSPEEKRNLVGFFELLVKVDKRINPELYKHPPAKPIPSNSLLKEPILAL